jgi:ABC-type bacteriocin/lantibiotic exporter with double-glycine peptidase domain
LILDEALSSVEEEIEDEILGNVRKFLYNSTVIVITHRVSTIGKMDMVYSFNSRGEIQAKPIELGKTYKNG